MTDTITLPRSVVEQALEALNASMPHNNDMAEDWPSHIAARRALRAALEQPVELEPDSDERVMTVVYRDPTREDVQAFMDHPKAVWFGWCHAPYQRDDARAQLQQPPRQPLTDEEIRKIGNSLSEEHRFHSRMFARAIERAHGIGDTDD